MVRAMEPAWRIRLRQLMADRNVNPKELSRLSGMNERLVYDLLQKTTNPRIETLSAVASALGVSVAQLRDGIDPDVATIPVIGILNGGEGWTMSAFDNQLIEFKLSSGEPVALLVQGDSMAPVYRDGDYLIGVRYSGSAAHNLIGTDCIVETEDGLRYIKYLARAQMRGRFNLRSYNPSVPDIENVRVSWVAPIQWVRRRSS